MTEREKSAAKRETNKERIRSKIVKFFPAHCEHCGKGRVKLETDKGIVFCSICEN